MTIGSKKTSQTTILAVLVCMACGLTGCGGTKILKEQEPLVLTEPLVAGSDRRAAVSLDWVIVRGGPGTWAKNADWDEYLLRVENTSDEPITFTSIVVYDSTSFMQEVQGNRKTLVKASRKTAKRYKGQDIKIKAGVGGATMVAVGGLGVSAVMGAGGGRSDVRQRRGNGCRRRCSHPCTCAGGRRRTQRRQQQQGQYGDRESTNAFSSGCRTG